MSSLKVKLKAEVVVVVKKRPFAVTESPEDTQEIVLPVLLH
jgi:hypothetical protein